jgi:glycosyltransferase involved in cell wall biosynthesis
VVFLLSNVHAFGLPAPNTFYVLQIPYTGLSPFRELLRAHPRKALKDLRRSRLLCDARRAKGVLVYSSFVKNVLHRYHDINSSVLYPPIDDFAADVPKERVILSVGRFFRGLYNDKQYDVLLHAFRDLHSALPPGERWEYHISGSCGQDQAAKRYLEQLRAAARGLPVFFHANAPYEELRHLYGKASIFWHGAGIGVDEEVYPERTEHFGMSTVEAMSAACVPVVVNRGGQKEIVVEGENGFLCETEDQLVQRSLQLVRSAHLRQAMGSRARLRFADFSTSRFFRSVDSFLTQHGL